MVRPTGGTEPAQLDLGPLDFDPDERSTGDLEGIILS